MELCRILLCLALVASVRTLERKKRYLNFPPKASIVLTISLLKNIASESPYGPTTRIVTIHELDVFFPLPNSPSPFRLTTATLGGLPVKHEETKHRRQRRDVFHNLEGLFDVQGYSGRSCILKTLCEAKAITVMSEDDILTEILLSIFRMPEDDPDYHVSEEDCLRHSQECPISVFDMAFKWAEHYLSEHNNNTAF